MIFNVSNASGKTKIETIPSVASSLIYNGQEQSPVWLAYDPEQLTMTGITSAVNAGTYQVAFTPTKKYKWEDGSSEAKFVEWTIEKATGSLSLSANSGKINGNKNSTSFVVSVVGDGAISAHSSNTSIATVSVSGTTVTITATGYGSATITVSATDGTNYKYTSDKTYAITVDYLYLYKRGDRCTSVTGGWTQYKYGGAYWYNGTVTYNSDHVYLAAGYATMAAIRTTNNIDLTNYTQLCITMSTSGGSTILTAQSSSTGGAHAAYTNSTTSTTVNISSLTGKYYIGVIASIPDDGDEDGYKQTWVYEVYLK